MIDFFKENRVLDHILSSSVLLPVLKVLIYLVAGILIIRIVGLLLRKLITDKLSPKSRMLVDKSVTYTGISILLVTILAELGVNLAALLGAAGIMGIAVGVASQKSLGNIVSGLFLLSEKAYEPGDVIKVGDKTGIVYSIDLLSVKIRTFDNLLIRLPNESIISNDVTNITRFPIRRMDFNITISYRDDINLTRDTLMAIARENPLCMNEPEPFFLLKDFGDTGIQVMFGIWFEKSEYLATRNSIFSEIIKRFAENGISITVPHITLYNGDEAKKPL